MKVSGKMPGKLSIRAGGAALFTGGQAQYNYAINGTPFLSAAANLDYGKRKIRRATAPFRKQQFDNQTNPGEQSLDGYWLRSQQSFHGGAGLIYSDPGPENPLSDIRFFRSKNVNVWTQGQVSLLHGVDALTKPDVREMFSLVTKDGSGCVIALLDDEISIVETDGTINVKTDPSAAVMRSVTSNGDSIFVASDDGIWRGPVPTDPADAIVWTQIYTYVGSGRQELAWVKERLVLGLEQALYELTSDPAGPPAALPPAFYTANPDDWTWTSISETSPAIYAVGSVGGVSSILKFTLDNTGGLPTLTGGTVAATLPGGETAVSVFGYLGNFLGIGTSKGARVAQSDDTGNLTYGPLLFETASPVEDWTGRDRWLWCTYSEAGWADIKLARIDLSLQIEPLRFAYATDLSAAGDSAVCKTVAFFGNTGVLAFATTADAYREDEETVQATGFLDTSRVRYSTLEPKVFRSLRVRGPRLDGALGVSIIDENGTVFPINSYGEDETPGADDLTLPGPDHRDYVSFRFIFNAGTDPAFGAVLNGWQVKALPASPRQRMITIPVWCFDFEKDRQGQRVGGHGKAVDRLLMLENLESAGGIVQFQDLDIDQAVDVFIESMEFEQGAPPPHFKGWGGIIFLQMRTV